MEVIIVLISVLVLLARVILKHRKTRRLLKLYFAKEINERSWFPVFYASPGHFHRFLKLEVFERAAILFVEPDSLTVATIDREGNPVKYCYPTQQTTLRWIGIRYFASNAMASFFELSDKQQKCYLSGGSLATVKNQRLTIAVYEAVEQLAPDVTMQPEASALPPRSKVFELESNRYSLAGVGFMLLILVYTIIDTIVNQEEFIGAPYQPYMIVVAVSVILLIFPLFKRKQIPSGEAIVLTVLISLFSVLATPPLLLRINQLTDVHGLQTYQYQVGNNFKLTAINDSKLPELYLPELVAIWDQIGNKESIDIELRKGILGIYQINMEPIKRQIEEHHEKLRSRGIVWN